MAKSRTEIDKDMMYRKIMPTSAKNNRSAGADEHSIPVPGGGDSTRMRPAAGLQLPESQDMVLINLMEDLVISRLESTLMRFNCCKCNKCKKDIAAIALNKLAPRYVVIKQNDDTKKAKAEEEFGSTVTGALVQAIMLVKKEPRH